MPGLPRSGNSSSPAPVGDGVMVSGAQELGAPVELPAGGVLASGRLVVGGAGAVSIGWATTAPPWPTAGRERGRAARAATVVRGSTVQVAVANIGSQAHGVHRVAAQYPAAPEQPAALPVG